MNPYRRLLQMRHKSNGFTVIEISLALILSAFVAFALFRSNLIESTQQGGTVQADQLLQIKSALESYIRINGNAIVTGAAVTGVANSLQPTIVELQNLQILPGQFSSLATLNRSPFVIQLSLLPSGCTLGTCVISGFVYVRDPILGDTDNPSAGQYDGVAVSAMLSRMGGDGFARVVPNGSLVAAGGAFSIANASNVAHPSITVSGQPYPAGIVGVRITPYTPEAPVSASAGAAVAGPCPGGTINNVVATGTTGNGTGNQCFFTYPSIPLGSSRTVANTQSSTTGSLTVLCLAINGNSTIEIGNLTCLKL